MKKEKKQRNFNHFSFYKKSKFKSSGITLIALIITIIVLLILAGVTIAAITGNESAMNKAVESKEKNEQGAELDAIKLAVVSSVTNGLDGYVETSSLKSSLTGLIQENPEDVIIGDGPWVVTSTLGRVYEINKNATINELTGLVLTPRNITLSIEGDTYEEKNITVRLIDIEGTLTWSDSTDIIDITPSSDGKSATIKAKKNGTETVTVTCSNGDSAECIVKVTKEMPLATSILQIDATAMTSSKKSPYVYYYSKDGNDENKILCRVLYNDSVHGLQIISDSSVESITLGKTDPLYTTGTTTEKAHNSYNNAIENLNNYAENYINKDDNIISDARCVGSVSNVTGNLFANKDDEILLTNPNNYSYLEPFVEKGYKWSDTHYGEEEGTDYYQMGQLGIRQITYQYWLASRYATYDRWGGTVFMRYVDNRNGGSLGSNQFFNIPTGDGKNYTLQLRPVFLITSSTRISGGTGISTDPYILEAGE